MRPVYIHAGAHRTGTSSFQLCLAQNRPVLEASGIRLAYPGRDGAPGGQLRLKLPRPWQKAVQVDKFAPGVREHIAKISGEDGKLVLSEENITGSMRHLLEGRFFPATQTRCKVLRKALGRPAHLVFVVRPYADFLLSAYRKLSENNAVPDFAQVDDAYRAMDRGWPDIVEIMRDTFEPERFSVLSYIRRGSSVDLLRRLVPDVPKDLSEPETTVNLSATDAGLMALQTRHRQGEKLRRGQWLRVIAAHASDTTDHGYAALTMPTKQALEAKWDADQDRLGKMQRIDFVC